MTFWDRLMEHFRTHPAGQDKELAATRERMARVNRDKARARRELEALRARVQLMEQGGGRR